MRDHAIMRDKADVLLELLDRDSMPPSDALADARWQLSSHIMQHLAFEDRHLYAKLMADPRPHVLETGRRFQAELTDMFADYTVHAKRWTPEAIAADWDGFRASARIRTHEMFARIDREEAELFPLACDAHIDTKTNAPPTANWARDAFAIKDAMIGGTP
jgi:hypothetical protein